MSSVSVIRVDPDDELPAILERLPRDLPCILVLPAQARALSSTVGAKLLARRAERQGTQLALVSDDISVAAHARAAGLRVAATLADARLLLDLPPGDEDDPFARASAALPAFDDPAAPDGKTSSTPAGAAPERHRAGDKAERTSRPSWTFDTSSDQSEATGAGWHDEKTIFYVAGEHDVEAAAAENRDDDVIDGEWDDLDRDVDEPAEVKGRASGARSWAAAGASRSARRLAPPATIPSRSPKSPFWVHLRHRLEHGGARGLLIPLLLIVVAILILFWLLSALFSALTTPSATVVVRLRPALVSGYYSNVNAIYHLPASKKGLLNYVEMYRMTPQGESATVTVPVRGTELVPASYARGEIQLANLLVASPVVVPKGTVFTTNLGEIGFATLSAVTVPVARQSFDNTRHGTVTAPVQATLKGANGNAAAQAVINVPSQFTGSLIVTNTVPISGGTDRRQSVVTSEDQAAAASTLLAQLTKKARSDIAAHLGPGADVHVLYVAQSPVASGLHLSPATDVPRTATLTLSIVMHAVYVHKQDLRAVALQSLQPAIALKPNYPLIPSSVNWTDTWRSNNETINGLDLAVTGETTPPVDPGVILKAIAGLSADGARAYLHENADIASSSISISPGWTSTMPTDMSRINLQVQKP